jgi:D-alanine-D-alanine ligase
MSSVERLRVAVLFGGKSLEHEISVISAYQVLEAFDSTRYDVVPVYIDPDGFWFTGPELRQRRSYLPGPALKKRLHRVALHTGSQLELQPIKGSWMPWRREQTQPIDIVFPVLHGTFGEDGCLQGMLELLGVPYAGPGPLAAAVSMNKSATKTFAAALGIPVLPGITLHRRDWDASIAEEIVQDVMAKMPFPIITKPCHLGSSIGVAAAETADQLLMNLAAAFVLDHEVECEPLLRNFSEYNVAVLGPSPGSSQLPRVSAIERPKRAGAVLSFEQKYMRGPGTKKLNRALSGMADLVRDLDPKDAADGVLQDVALYARRMYSALGLKGSPRFDFLYDLDKSQLYLNEINPLPGSCAFYLWEAAEPRLCFTELLHELVQEALADFHERHRSQRSASWRIFHPEPTNR